MIKQGDTLPDINLQQRTKESTQEVSLLALSQQGPVVVFAVPGAFTPTCSAAHLPGYVALADKFEAKGAKYIACVSVNDAFVMQAWGEAHNAEHILMLGDGDAAFTQALGLDMDTKEFGGVRSQRYAMIVEDGKVRALNVEKPKTFEVSKAEVLLELL